LSAKKFIQGDKPSKGLNMNRLKQASVALATVGLLASGGAQAVMPFS
jgi:hypothetical protein